MLKPEIPVDKLTRFPLPFFPSPDLPPPPPPGEMRYDPTLAGYHHAIPRTNGEATKTDIGVQAAIDSRLQWVLKDDHVRYHDKWGKLGQYFPRTPARQCHTAVFVLADYVPDYGIDFSRRQPAVGRMSQDQRKQLRQKGQFIFGYNGVRIRRFLLEHSMEQGSGAVDQNIVDEFLDLSLTLRKPERLQSLADILLQQTVEPIITPGISQIYRYMKEHELVRPGVPSALSTLIKNEIRLAFTGERFIGKLAYLFSALRTTPVSVVNGGKIA